MHWRSVAAFPLVLAAAGAAAFWWLTAPNVLVPSDLPQHAADLANGARIFNAGGCASCHAMPKAEGSERLKLGGWLVLETAFGKFHVPNISPDKATGIGLWTETDFANAMLRGVGPGGVHLYPAFPYTCYSRMAMPDVLDLFAYLKTLPPVGHDAGAHELAFPFNVRRGLGLWKLAFLHPGPVVALPAGAPAEVQRGRYLAEGPAHCSECHTPRGIAGNPDLSRWLAGAPNPENPKGHVPDITPSLHGGIGGWSKDDIVTALQTGITPDGDSLGGSMADVVTNMAQLPPEDVAAIAAYLKAVPPVDKVALPVAP